MTPKQIIIKSLQLRPFSDQSFIATDYPGTKHFDDRNDFLLFAKQHAVAVLLTARPESTDMPHNTVTEKITVRIVDLSNHSVVASEAMTVQIDQWEETVTSRIDLPFSAADVQLEHKYEVRVCRGHGIIARHALRFFRLNAPFRQDYDVMWACLREGDTDYRSVSGLEHNTAEVVFHMHKTGKLDPRLPEFWLRMVDCNGKEWFRQMKYVIDGNDEECPDDYFTLRCTIDFRPVPWGVTYVELLKYGFAMAGMLFDTMQDDEEGFYGSEDTKHICYYTVETGRMEMAKRRGDSVLYVDLNGSDDSDNDDDTDTDIGIDFDEDEEDEEDEEEEETEEIQEELPGQPSAQEQLAEMVGLEDVKARLTSYNQLMTFAKRRRNAGLSFGQVPLHAMFLGSPGTGKTTVAKIMGAMLKEAGVLSSGHVVVRERSTLSGPHYGDEEEKTLEALKEAEGGILFIDEAYQLHQPADGKDPGHFVLDALMTALADDKRRNWMLILAGYTKPMLRMLELNPGLASRIPATNHYHFADYGPRELFDIAERWFRRNQYILTPHAIEALRRRLESDYEQRGDDFGNARHVLNLIETSILPAMARRLDSMSQPTREELQLVHACDIPQQTQEAKKSARRAIGFTA